MFAIYSQSILIFISPASTVWNQLDHVLINFWLSSWVLWQRWWLWVFFFVTGGLHPNRSLERVWNVSKMIIFFYVLLPFFISITLSTRISLQHCLVQRIRQVSSSSRSWSTTDPHLWYILTQAWLKSTMFPYYDHFNSDHLVISTFQHAAKILSYSNCTQKANQYETTAFQNQLQKGQACSSLLYVLKSGAVSPQIVSGFQPFNLGLKDTDARIASDRSWTKCEPTNPGTAFFHNNKNVEPCRK